MKEGVLGEALSERATEESGVGVDRAGGFLIFFDVETGLQFRRFDVELFLQRRIEFWVYWYGDDLCVAHIALRWSEA